MGVRFSLHFYLPVLVVYSLTMSTTSFTINQVIILHSLEHGDVPTYEEVARQINYVVLRKNFPEFVQLLHVPNRAKLFEELEGINQHTKNWLKPLIHFEMHGSPNGLGLAEENDIVTWEELKEPIRKINITFKRSEERRVG